MIDKIKNNGNYIIFGILVSLIITFISLIALACILTYTSVSENIINPSIIVINAISIFIGTTIALNNQKSKGILKGSICGTGYILIMYLLSSIVSMDFKIGISSGIMLITSMV